jgi:hypothetical protein
LNDRDDDTSIPFIKSKKNIKNPLVFDEVGDAMASKFEKTSKG